MPSANGVNAVSGLLEQSKRRVEGVAFLCLIAGHRSRTASLRKAVYAFSSPSRSEIFAFHPIADSREASRSFRGMPSGLEVS
jgi:hypothetical protein